jgi:hypothetical protein
MNLVSYCKKLMSYSRTNLFLKISLFLGVILVASCGTSSDSGSRSSGPADVSTGGSSGGSSSSPSQTPSLPTTVPSLTRIELADATDNMSVINIVANDSTIDLADLPASFNFVVTSEDVDNTGSVGIEITGCAAFNRTENNPPFTVAAQGEDFSSLILGACTVTATPYELPSLGGVAGTSFTIDFTVVDSSVPAPVPSPTPDVGELSRIQLVNASDLEVIQNIENGSVIDLNGLPPLFNFVVTSTDVANTGSVDIDMSGCAILDRYENNAPYTVAVQGVDFASLSEGSCSITATPYESADVGGVSGTPLAVSFSVEDSTPEPIPPPPSPTPTPTDGINADINPSRTNCVSPCTVVFSADQTTAEGLDDHGIWSQLIYYWDFDTDESDTYGSLYDQTYTYVSGDTAYEIGGPMATKTFLCETGTCTYNVGMRAQNAVGAFDDTSVTITVRSTSAEWSAANTVCVSNTLSTSADWTAYDKACPAGATKRNDFPAPDEYGDKLILLKRGDVFDSLLVTLMSESNFKISSFGDVADGKPQINERMSLGAPDYFGDANAPTGVSNFWTNSDVTSMGWPSNIYIEDLKLMGVTFPMSHNHVGLHDIDLDRGDYQSGGFIGLSTGRQWCTDQPTRLSCDNVPFAKGAYISKVDVVGGRDAENNVMTLNVSAVGCDVTNFTGITDSRFRKAGEHNLRIMGWWRLNIMRSFFRGEHYSPGKQKLTIRPCVHGSVDQGAWQTHNGLPDGWRSDPEGRTRADLFLDNGTDQYIHLSRYQVIQNNRLGDSTAFGDEPGSTQYQTNALGGDDGLLEDILITKNVFVNDVGVNASKNIDLSAYYSVCVSDNTYATSSSGCAPSNLEDNPGSILDATPLAAPQAPSI